MSYAMDPTRRTLLTGIAALSATSGCSSCSKTAPNPTDTAPASSSPTPSSPTLSTPSVSGPEPTVPWNPPGTVDQDTFACAVQTGDVLPNAALVSVRQFDEATLELVLARGVDDGWEEVQRIADLAPTRDVVQIELKDLVPDTTYSVVFYAADGVRRSPAARFRTALAEGTTRTIRFGATSCLGSPNAPWPSMSRVATQKLDFFLLLGDTIYADEGFSPAGQYPEHWTNALSTAGLRDLTLSTSVVATWDDHEVNNDWSWEDDSALIPAALEAYRDGIPQRKGPGGSLIWRSLKWGDAIELFVLDCRGERQNGNYVSSEQLDWLKNSLASSTARFKIILNSVPITDLDSAYFGSGDVGWTGYPNQREELLAWIADQSISGILWLTGDVHWGTIATVGKPGTRDSSMWEVFCGPAGSTINLLASTVDEDEQFSAVYLDWNTVTFEANPDTGTVLVSVEGDTGTILTRSFR